MPTTLAHVSDLHLGPLPPFAPRHWNLKRALGVANWHRKRKALHRAEAWELLLADLRRHSPDHVAVTGDLINVGLPAEYGQALSRLAAIGPPDRVSVVPGNHDIYTRLWRDPGVARWGSYMRSDDWGEGLGLEPGVGRESGFPFVRRVGRLALVGLNSALPTPPGLARGRIGARQMALARAALDHVAARGLLPVVLIHHPPLPGQAPAARALADARAMAALLASAPPALVLHGHNHLDMLARGPPPGEAIVVGVASGSAARAHGEEPAARYGLLRISEREDRWQIEFERRGLDPATGAVIEISRQVLELRGALMAERT